MITIRNLKVCRDFRSGVKNLQNSLDSQDKLSVNETLAAVEKLARDMNSGSDIDPSKQSHKIGLSLPFVGGLGTEINLKLAKLNKKPKDKILTFLHKAVTSSDT